jgi:hypothetical protein
MPTGYGTQTKAVVNRLADAGFPMSIAANYGVQGVGSTHYTPKRLSVPVYPIGYDGYSQDVISSHYAHFAGQHPDRKTVMVTLYDAWVLRSPRLDAIPAIFAWTPLDHLTIPPEVAKVLARPNVIPVAMSQYGSTLMGRMGITHHYIPHTVEQVFKRTKMKEEQLPFPDDAFVVMMNAANKGSAPTRKAWSENLMALVPFLKAHTDVCVYIHTEAASPHGIDLLQLVEYLGLPSERVKFPEQYSYRHGGYTDYDLAQLYSRADVLLAVSMGEGFGIPTIEAEACGTRVIGSDAAATPELLSEDSFLVEGQPEWDPSQRSFWFRPFVHSITAALEEAYRAGGGHSDKAVKKASEYRADRIILKQWAGMIQAVAG